MARLGRDPVAVRIVRGTDVAGTEVERVVHRALRACKILLELAPQAIAAQAGEWRSGAQAGFGTVFATSRPCGDGDDAPRGAAAVDGAAATDDFYPFDQCRVDVGQVA
ncbi:hypothetical protein D3C75_1158350 [compost metagenome]